MSPRPPFTNRWAISGTLTLTSDLFLGDGGLTALPEVARNEEAPLVASVARDGAGRPVIPGPALKGVLRAFVEDVLPGDDARRRHIERVFGRAPDPTRADPRDPRFTDQGVGGSAVFHYAYLDEEQTDVGDTAAIPYWQAEQRSGVAPSVGIDRVTRTHADRLLYYREFIPSGAVFRVEITAQDLDPGDLDLLLDGLEGFHDEYDPVRLGAGSADHQGRASWKLEHVRLIDAASLRAWLSARQPRPGSGTYPEFPGHAPKDLAEAAKGRVRAAPRKPRLVLDVDLYFDGPFLVNDPWRAKKDGNADHVPRLTSKREPLLPARSIRGAFRSQAERIARTLNPQAGGDPHRPPDERPPDQAYPLELLFGCAALAAAVEFNDFVGTRPAPDRLRRQEFVAIDRFTGGVSGSKKFNADYVPPPVTLSGRVCVPLDRVPPYLLGLLCLTLRDLREGDVTVGFGASKGFGACTAQFTKWSWVGLENLPGEHADLLPNDLPAPERQTWLADPANREQYLRACVRQLSDGQDQLSTPQEIDR